MSSRPRAVPCVLLAEEVWGSGLQAMRSLGRAGVPVYIATAGAGAAIYGRSRYCTAAADFDPSDPERFCGDVLRWLADLGVGSDAAETVPVIPLSDRLVEALDGSRATFGPQFRLSIADPDVVHALLDKTTSLRIAEQAGLDVPPWVALSTIDQLNRTDRLDLPVAVRPTAWSTVGSAYFKVAVSRSREELHQQVASALAAGAELIVQEYVEAADSDVEMAITWNDADHHVAVCTGRKRRQAAPDGGVMVWGETVELSDVREQAVRFLEVSGFTGLGGLEFIRSGDRPWFIEFNPRLEAIHFLATAAGLDTVLMEYDALALGLEPATAPTPRPATAWVGSAWLTRLMADPSSWRLALSDRLAFERSPGRIKAVWTRQDPMPSAALLGRLVNRGARSVLRSNGGRR